MCDWIKWGELESAEMSYNDAFYIIITVLVVAIAGLIILNKKMGKK